MYMLEVPFRPVSWNSPLYSGLILLRLIMPNSLLWNPVTPLLARRRGSPKILDPLTAPVKADVLMYSFIKPGSLANVLFAIAYATRPVT